MLNFISGSSQEVATIILLKLVGPLLMAVSSVTRFLRAQRRWGWDAWSRTPPHSRLKNQSGHVLRISLDVSCWNLEDEYQCLME